MVFGLLWQLVLETQMKELPSDPNAIHLTEDDSAKQILLKWTKERLANCKQAKIEDFSQR